MRINDKILIELYKKEYDSYNKKLKLMEYIKNWFEGENDTRENLIVILSGHGGFEKFYLNEKNEEFISYDDISNIWIKRRFKNHNKLKKQNLLIIIDSCYSGSWVEKNKRNLHYCSHISISVISSCEYDRTSVDHPEFGGSLIFGLKALNTSDENTKKKFKEFITNYAISRYSPKFSGFSLKLNEIYGINLFLDSSFDLFSDYLWGYKEYEIESYQGYYKHFKKLLGRYMSKGFVCYEGELKNDKRCGYGIEYHTDGSRYEGEWKDNKRNGYGIFFWNDNTRYEGQYKDNERNGFGIFYWNDGRVYQGEWKNFKRDGYGIYFSKNGTRYEGEWKNDIRDGFGIMYKIDGRHFVGEWKDNQRNGYGIYFWNNGERYEGEYKDDKRHGIGTEYYIDGRRYEGEYRDNNRDRTGTFFNHTGTISEQQWQEGIKISKTKKKFRMIK